DLFYRLSVFPVAVLALRDRGDDVVQLAKHFLEQTCKDFGREPMKLTRTLVDKLRAYRWPGNVRELKNVIERAVILSPGPVLRLDISIPELRAEISETSATGNSQNEILNDKDVREFQKKNIIAALEQSGWRVSGPGGAAELLDVRPTTLADRIKTMGIRKP
ncbi:MAG: sigma-54-dependent Fis family transcriptional regulator, partial [Woeseiaceae bacterium]